MWSMEGSSGVAVWLRKEGGAVGGARRFLNLPLRFLLPVFCNSSWSPTNLTGSLLLPSVSHAAFACLHILGVPNSSLPLANGRVGEKAVDTSQSDSPGSELVLYGLLHFSVVSPCELRRAFFQSGRRVVCSCAPRSYRAFFPFVWTALANGVFGTGSPQALPLLIIRLK